jgi:capsular exopolysaccharide synthesis family protein
MDATSTDPTAMGGGQAGGEVTGQVTRPQGRAFMPSGLAASVSAPTPEPKLRDYLRILSYHWKLLILVAAVPIAGSVAYTLLKSRRYRARAVLVKTEGASSKSRGGDVPLRIALETVARSEKLLDSAHALFKTKLEKVKRTLPCAVPSRGELRTAVTASIEGRGSDLVITATVSARKNSPSMTDRDYGQLAACMADAVSDALIGRAKLQRREAVRELRSRIETQLNKKSDLLGTKFKEIIRYRARMSSGGSDAPLPSEIDRAAKQLAMLETLMRTAVFRRDELDQKLKRIVQTIEKTEIPIPDPDLRELKQALIKTEMALAYAEIRYQKTHPKYKKLLQEKNLLVAKVRGLSRKAANPKLTVDIGRLLVQRELVEAELAGLRARISTIKAARDEEREKLSTALEKIKDGIPTKALSEMLREKEVLTSAIAALQQQLEGLDESRVPAALPNLAVLSKAIAPSAPYTPRWAVNLPVGLGLAMVLMLAAAFIAENLEDRIRDQRDLVQNFHLPFLGPVPLWREGEPKLIDLSHPRSVIADVFGVLRNNIGYALPPGVPKSLLVASSVVGEGKSTIAANLAISYCLDGNNVLLIDTDLRRPRAHRLFESLCPQAASSPGLTGYLSDRAESSEILYQASVPGLSIISAGRGAINPSKLLGSEKMRQLIKDVTEVFDAVILDGPAVLPVVDSTVVSGLASGVLLVVSSKRAPSEQIATAVARLEHVKAPLIGMVLNRQPGGSRGYYQYYGSRYGYGYSHAHSYAPGEDSSR